MWWQVTRAPEPGGGERLAFVDAGQRRLPRHHDRRARGDRHAGFFWEMPALRTATRDAPYECVLLPAPDLARATPDRFAFAEQFAAQSDGDVIAFPNLGGDATLVVPRPLAADAVYGHIAAFVRAAPAAQQQDLLRVLATTATAAIGATPIWLSTSGLGVAWLHVRLDALSKYYQCGRYRDRP